MKTRRSYNKILACFFLIFSAIIILFGINVGNVFASEKTPSNVIDDLEVDDTFDINNYPKKDFDSSTELSDMANVINIAENENNQLYIYVYQPYYSAFPFKLDSISMSTENTSNGNYSEGSIKSYDLEFCNSYETLYKYLIKDYQISNDAYRYYGLVAMWRPFIEGLDSMASGAVDQKVSISIGQQWCVYTLNDSIKYEMATFDTLEITPVFTGTFEFSNGFSLGNISGSFSWGNSHFICFNAENYVIKHIYDADMTYQMRSVSESFISFSGTNYEYGDYEEKFITLTDIDSVTYKGNGLFAKEYNCNRIMSSSDFIANYQSQNINVDSEVENKIKSSQWVFSFTETQYSMVTYIGGYTSYYYECADVTILRLHFMDINNKIYNLGVVMDKTTADTIPDGNAGPDFSSIWNVLKYVLLILGVILVLLALGLLLPIASIIFKVLFYVIKIIFKGLVWIITAPFKLIKWIFTGGKMNE